MRLNNILYIHIPRTGGTHFERLLGFKDHALWPEGPGSRAYGFRTDTLMGWHKDLGIMTQHATYKEMVEHNFIKEQNSYLKVTIVRNPYPRAVSLYKYFGGARKWKSFDKFLDELSGGKNIQYFYQPQYKFVTLDNRVVIDNIIKFESYEQDVLKFKNRYNLKFDVNFRTQQQEEKFKKVLKKYYNDDNYKRVESIYAEDFVFFNYEKLSR